MKSYTQEVGAGNPWFAQLAGRLLMIDVAAGPVTVTFLREQRPITSAQAAQQGYRAEPAGGFDGFLIESATTQTVTVFVTDGSVTRPEREFNVANLSELAQAIDAELRATPLPVSNDRGTPGNLLHVTGVSLSDAPAVSINEPAAVAVTDVLTALVAADADRRALRFLNQGADPVAIGAAGLTWAKRVIVLEAGDVWIEDRAANLAWSAICEAGTTATVGVQEVLA